MGLKKDAKLLRIFLGESDKLHHTALYEVIVHEARTSGLAGATVHRAIMGYGPTNHVRTERVLDLAANLPVTIEIVDTDEKIKAFLPELKKLFELSGCGGLTTVEKVEVV